MIEFTKMHALGNDFVVINTLSQPIKITRALMQFIADRHRGVGCDQVLLVTQAENPQADFGYRIFNADGSEVYQCGNGARCLGLFIRQEKLSDQKDIVLETKRGLIRISYLDNNEVLVDIAKPSFVVEHIPFVTQETHAPYHLKIDHRMIEFDVVTVGNPHCILRVDTISRNEVNQIGAALNAHSAFPEGVNVGFLQYDTRDRIHLCVYERGVGITEACGSGACAAVAVGRKNGYLNSTVQVIQAGGELAVHWHALEDFIQLRGSGETVFIGQLWKFY